MTYIQISVVAAFFQYNFCTSEIGQCQSVGKVIYQFFDFIIIIREVQVGTPAEVVSELLVPSDIEFKAFVFYITGVYITVSQAWFVRSRNGEELIFSVGFIISQVDIQSVL